MGFAGNLVLRGEEAELCDLDGEYKTQRTWSG